MPAKWTVSPNTMSDPARCPNRYIVGGTMAVMPEGREACTVGSLPTVPAVSLHYGQASVRTRSDFASSRDGILTEGNANQGMMAIGEPNLRTIVQTRTGGTLLPLHDSARTSAVVARPEVVAA